MKQYYRQKNSIYANYRYSNPNSANFIAPQAKSANFSVLDTLSGYLSSDMPQHINIPQHLGGLGEQMDNLRQMGGQYFQQGMNALRGGANAIGNGAQDLYAEGVARTGINLPGLAQQAQDAVGGAAQGIRGAVGGAYDAIRGGAQDLGAVAGDAAQGAGQYIQQHPGQDALAAGGAAGLGGGAALLARLKNRLGQGAQAVEQGAPSMMQRGQQMLQQGADRFNQLPMGAKVGAGALGAAGLGGAGYLGYNAMNQDPEAQYRANLAYNANFRKRTR